MILATVRHISTEDANIKAKNPQWQTLVPTGLSGKTMGLIGLGRLGTQTATVRSIFKL
jgi:phosphoglycerate dehydrogenase-like enzyme